MARLIKPRMLYQILKSQPQQFNVTRCCSKHVNEVWEIKYQDHKDAARMKKQTEATKERDYITALMLFLQREIDVSFKGFQRFFQRVKDISNMSMQSYNAERLRTLGPELSAAYVILQLGGAVKFLGHEKWNRKTDSGFSLPKKYIQNVYIDGIDASNTTITTPGLQCIETVKHLRWLSVENCRHVDDWFLDRLAHFQDTLEYLDISKCENVTERGVAVLHRLRKLKTLKVAGLPRFQNAEIVCILLEELLPDCKIEGVNYLNDVILPDTVEVEFHKE